MHRTIEWAAGLFEGEGSINQDKRTKRQYSLEINMTDKDVIEAFRDTVGAGNITTRYENHPNKKPQWRVRISKREEVRRILGEMLPFFGNRRAYKALNVLDDLECT